MNNSIQSIILTILICVAGSSKSQNTILYTRQIPFDNVRGLYYLSPKDTCTTHFVLPNYSLGNSHLVNYLSNNLKYPINYETGEREYIKGNLVVSFLINEFGKVENLNIIESPHQQVSDQITSAIGKLKSFYPAKCDSIPLEISIFFKANFMAIE